MNNKPEKTQPDTPPEPNNRREQFGWYLYDWANSAFATTVIAVFLGPYLTSIAEAAADAQGRIYPLGIAINFDAFYPFLIALSVITQVLVLPILGAFADYSHLKKQLLGLFAYIGAVATMGMYFLQGTNYLLGGLLFLVANLSFGASIVFYNAFLPEIATADRRDAVSARGWALGYLGGGVLLALNLLLYARADGLGLTEGQAARISLLSAGVWWAIFTLIPLATLRRRYAVKPLPPGERYLSAGFRQLGHTLRELRFFPQTLLFLVAYLLYNDGIQAVIALSAQFGGQELGLPLSSLTALILMVQFVAFFGALAFSSVARLIGSKQTIMVSLLIWAGALIYAYAWLETEGQFFAMGAVIALVLGGTQALSRSVFSLMIPRGHEAEYFSLYEISERGTSWLAPLLFGLALQYTDSYRIAIVSLIIFFLLGLVLLIRVDVRQAALAVGNEPPALPRIRPRTHAADPPD
jgi:UMF1 family MFS transporter